MAVSPDGHLMPHPPVDEVEDGFHTDDLVDHLMFQVDLVLTNTMEMSIGHLEAHEDLDDPDVEEEDVAWSTSDAECPNEDAVGDDGLMVVAPSWDGGWSAGSPCSATM